MKKFGFALILFVISVLVFARGIHSQSCASELQLGDDNQQYADQYAMSVAISGPYIVVGAPRDDDAGNDAGSIFIYHEMSPGTWIEVVRLEAQDASPSSQFGNQVAIDGSTIVVGALEDSNEGAVYIFYESAGVWSQTQKLTLNVVDGYEDQFGGSIAISGSVFAVGAEYDEIGSTSSAGSVSLYSETSPGVWAFSQIVYASDASESNRFSHAIALDGTTLVATSIYSSAAYVFISEVVVVSSIPEVVWSQTQILTSPVPSQQSFGSSIALSGSLLVVGDGWSDINGYDSGSVDVFTESSPGQWAFVTTIASDDNAGAHQFGQQALFTNGEVIIVGVPSIDDDFFNSGAVYAFTESGVGVWTQSEKLRPSDPEIQLSFGHSIAYSSSTNTLIVGAMDYGPYSIGSLYVFSNFGLSDVDECAAMPCMNEGVCSTGDLGTCDFTFTCDCSGTGFDGDLCQTDVDDCLSSPCENNGMCTDAGTNAFICDCTDTGFEGDICQTDINDCLSNPCMNEGVCTDTGTHAFTCDCAGTGFDGDLCQTDVDDCLSSPCENNGMCADAGTNAFICDCTDTGFAGDMCQTDINDCLSSPCMNSGVCEDAGVAAFMCQCAATGYEGDLCENDIDDCLSAPCMNNAACEDRGINQFNCNCTNTGFYGDLCEINECLSSPCMNNGVCTNAGGVFCDCTGTGYEGDHCGLDIDDCVSAPCMNNGVCVDAVNSFACNCSDTGYEGVYCEVSLYVNPCLSDPCQNDGVCVEKAEFNSFICDCASGYEGQVCDTMAETIESSLEIIVEFKNLAENATLTDLVNKLPGAVAFSEEEQDLVVAIRVDVPIGYDTDDLVENDDGSLGLVVAGYAEPIPVVQAGDTFVVVVEYANVEGANPDEIERRLNDPAAGVTDLTTDMSVNADVKVQTVFDDTVEEDAAHVVVPLPQIFVGLMTLMLTFV